MTAATTSASTQAGASTRSERRNETTRTRSKSRGGCAGSPSARTRSCSRSGAAVGSARNSHTSSPNSCSKSNVSVADIAHHLLESFQCPAQTCRAGGRADSEDAGGRGSIELEQHPQRHDLALCRREPRERRLERARPERRLFRVHLLARVSLLAATPPLLGAEVIERGAARDPAEPGTRRSSAGIEAPPGAERLLERLPRQILGHGPVSRQEQQVAVNGVELGLGDR